MSSATELYKHLNQGEIINIGMHPEHNEAQKKLSNLYPSPFTLDGIEYASVEAFRMSIKYHRVTRTSCAQEESDQS